MHGAIQALLEGGGLLTSGQIQAAGITEEALRAYFLYLKNEKHYSRAASTIALCGIKFFYEHTLQRDWTTLTFVRPPQEPKLPVILSRDAVRPLLQCVRSPPVAAGPRRRDGGWQGRQPLRWRGQHGRRRRP